MHKYWLATTFLLWVECSRNLLQKSQIICVLLSNFDFFFFFFFLTETLHLTVTSINRTSCNSTLSYLLSRNSMIGCRTLSASWATLLAFPTLDVPFTWAKMSPICFTFSSIWGWKLCRKIWSAVKYVLGRSACVLWRTAACGWFFFFLPDSKDSAQIVHDVVEFNLQILQDVTGFYAELNK